MHAIRVVVSIGDAPKLFDMRPQNAKGKVHVCEFEFDGTADVKWCLLPNV